MGVRKSIMVVTQLIGTLYTKMENKLLIVFLLFFMVMGFASAYDNIGTYRTNTPLNLNLGCSYNNTYCPNTFNCNVTIYNKNGILINNQQMGTSLFPQYNYTILASQMNLTGLYYGRQVCCGSIGCADYSFQFEVNAQGKQYDTIQGSIYAILFILLVGIFGFSLFASLKIPFKNLRNREGSIVQINWKKYLKIFMFAMAYMSLIGITYFAWNLSYGILEFNEMAGFFNVFYTILMILIFPILLMLFIVGLIKFAQDKSVEKMLSRGLTIK